VGVVSPAVPMGHTPRNPSQLGSATSVSTCIVSLSPLYQLSRILKAPGFDSGRGLFGPSCNPITHRWKRGTAPVVDPLEYSDAKNPRIRRVENSK